MFSLTACLAFLENEKDEEAFLRYYERYHRLVLYEAEKIVGPSAAEDVMQNTFVYIAKHFSTFRSGSSKKVTHLAALCARRRALDYLRRDAKQAGHPAGEPPDEDTDSVFADAALGVERKALLRARRRSLHVVRKTLVAAVIVLSMLFATLMTNAEMRAAVVNTLIEWTENFVRIQYEVEGKGPAVLPEGYGPHYIPDGFVYQEELSYSYSTRFSYAYESTDRTSMLNIEVGIAQTLSGYVMDNEHIDYVPVPFNDVTAYLGTFRQHDGYVLLWTKDNIEHQIYLESSTIPLSEVYRIAENIY
ncbi:DUF4367 domain-containing protein [bacterium 210917-DFI.7.65]|nr:DUF4367 domain-containing protein [bacterium 210917-DFI.7.65]